MAGRAGRGRLSSIDLLPPEADPIVAWAMQELRARDRTQEDIRVEFNERLEKLALDHGLAIEPISRSAFHRHGFRLAKIARRLEETRAIAGALTERLGADQSDDLTVMVSETIKTLVLEMLEGAEAGGIDPKGAAELARAHKTAVQAQAISTDRRRKIEKEFAEKTEQAIEKVAKAKGLTADTVKTIKASILGIDLGGGE
ncbi:Skp family chaperone for outer membrane proteins [Rhodobium orientis]|uniref:phage protein Gp27 family protein n=2 Tax=Rhodobium orientis TaxID=34017 RepID=UPI00161B5AC6|nr:Skp family chaperone for outer membrane proteins [Rhodobium orientis]MBK5949044.1 hypothetical protein [Rhodobium orientis]